MGTRVLVTPTKNSNQKKPKIQNNMSLLEIFKKSKNTKNNTITKSISETKSKKWFYENGGHKENEDLKNEIKHLKGQMKKVILENEKLKTAANNEITIVRNVDTEKDETISLKRKATSENNNSTSWLSLTSANNQKFKKVKTEFQDKVADLDEKVADLDEKVEDLDENYNYQILFTNNKLTEIDKLKEQIKQLNKEKAVQEKLTSELLKKVKRLGGRE